ncbi:unnamed protein product [Heterobilharzia americana]|nr:unnamed protein product [Heterobilharzia americana]
MTTSCVVAFGSSAPRSICTQTSAAALRLKQAFEARLASYLTGRHSGCFFTAAATPYYSCFIDPSHVPRPPTSVYKSRPSNRGVAQTRRASSAHASVLHHTKSSYTRVTHARRPQNVFTNRSTVSESDQSVSTKDSKSLNTNTVPDEHNLEGIHTSEVISNRSNSSSECDRVGRPNQRRKFTTIDGTERVTDAKNRENKVKVKNAAPSSSHSAVSARSSSAEGNSRQTSASVFERLASSRNTQKDKQKPSHSSDCTLNSKKISQNNRETKRNGNFAVPSVMAKSVSKTLPSRRCSPPPSCPSNIQESGTATASFPTVPQSLSLSESEIKAFTTEGFSDAIVSSDKSAPPDSSKVVDVKDDLLAFASQVGPIKAETHGSGDGVVLSEMEAAVYRAKLIEQRRLAKERRQKEEEEEKRRVEEENRLRSMQQEQARLAAEEELRLKEEQAIRQAEETQRKKEAEEIARLEAEKAERLAKLQRDEEERSLRRKKLHTIMSRVKRSSSPEKTNDVQHCEIDKINQRVCSDINAHHNDTDIPIFDSTQDDSSIVRTVVNKKLCNNVEKTGESSSTDINHEEELEVDNATLTVASGQNETLARNLITMPSLDPDSSVTQNTPVFKSALLQSMLAKGRLSTHVKEAVAGLRRNASQTQVNSSEDDSPLHYPLMNAANEDIDSVIMKHESSKTTSENCGLPHFNGSK